VLAHPPTASVTRLNTGEVVELFEGGWLELGEGLPPARVIVARHPAPPAGKKVTVGKRVDEWVYELFITTLGADGFLVEDVLDLSHGRGAFEVVLADEDVEEDPDRWCSRFSRHKRALGGTGKKKGFSMRYHNPLNGS
jgi:hypothetical protein